MPASPPARDVPLPGPTARIAGAALALLTTVLSAFLAADTLGGGLAAVDVAARFVAAGALAAVALALAALSLAPRAVRSLLNRRAAR